MALFLGGKKVTINTETRRNVPIDTTLSASSTNPVTNSAITTSLNSIQTSMTSAQGDISTLQASMTSVLERLTVLEGYHTGSNEGIDDNLDDILG